MRLISLTCKDGTMWTDPQQIIIIQPVDDGSGGSRITLGNNSCFYVKENPSWVAEKVHTAEIGVLS